MLLPGWLGVLPVQLRGKMWGWERVLLFCGHCKRPLLILL